MIYSETEIFDPSFDQNAMEVGDSFDMNGTRYTIERKYNEGPFMRYTKEPVTIFVVSFGHGDGGPFYQVCVWNGDWEGCHPQARSVEDALFAELARLNETENAAGW